MQCFEQFTGDEAVNDTIFELPNHRRATLAGLCHSSKSMKQGRIGTAKGRKGSKGEGRMPSSLSMLAASTVGDSYSTMVYPSWTTIIFGVLVAL